MKEVLKAPSSRTAVERALEEFQKHRFEACNLIIADRDFGFAIHHDQEDEVIDLQPVKKGQLLMTIDDRIYRQRVHQAQAQLAMKQAALNNNLQQRRSAEATIQSNRAALASAHTRASAHQACGHDPPEASTAGTVSAETAMPQPVPP